MQTMKAMLSRNHYAAQQKFSAVRKRRLFLTSHAQYANATSKHSTFGAGYGREGESVTPEA